MNERDIRCAGGDVVQGHFGRLVTHIATFGVAGGAKVALDFRLPVDGDRLPGQTLQVDTMRTASEGQLEAPVHQTFALQPFANARLVQQGDSTRLQQARANARSYVFASALFQHYRGNALSVQQLRQQQPGRAAADDDHLGTLHTGAATEQGTDSVGPQSSCDMDAGHQYLYFSTMLTKRQTAARIPAFFLYGEPLRTPDAQAVHVETIAARSEPRGWTIQPHRHHALRQLLLVHRGSVAASLDGLAQTLRGPALLVLPAGCVHAFRFAAGTDGFVVSFGGALPAGTPAEDAALRALFDHSGAHPLNAKELRATDTLRIAKLLLQEFLRAAPGRDLALRGLLATFLANLQRLVRHVQQAAGTEAADRERVLVAQFRALVDLHYREHWGLARYGQALDCSVVRLRRACLAVGGQAPASLVQQRLVVEAARQLRYTTTAISEVAYSLGFADPAYFTRFFTRLMGVAPRSFRQAG